MKIKKQEIVEAANAKVRVPFFLRGVDPESLRGVRGGDDELDARERKIKLDGETS
jgi:hypothetical protein